MENIFYFKTALVCITLALVFYSVGTWSERIQGTLKLWHIICFILGLLADSSGTWVMSDIAENSGNNHTWHAVTGLLAIILMAVHAVWAIYTYWRGGCQAKQNFSRFSVIVWAFWLVPYLLGIFWGMHQ